MICVERRADFINKIANDASVRPFMDNRGVDEPMDFTPICEFRPGQCGVVALSNGEDAVGIFEITGEKRFQAHTMFGPTCRGRRAIDTAKEMLSLMFSKGWATSVWGYTPINNRKARWFNRQIGAKPFARVSDPVEGELELFEVLPNG